MPTATVVICTRNRAASLRRTLCHLAAQTGADQGQWDVLVVNNGSVDTTSQVVEEFAGRLPIREVCEPTAGVSVARNTGVREATGLYVIWADDDVIPSEQWVATYLRAFTSHPDCALFGGKIDAAFDGEEVVPRWLRRNANALHLMLTVRDPGRVPMPIPNARKLLPFCANCAVERAVLLRFPFDPEVGYAPGRRRGGEEMDVFERMIGAGHHGLWLPDASVIHVMESHRQTFSHLRSFYRAVGETVYFRKSPKMVGRSHVAKLAAKWAAASILYAALSVLAPSWSVRPLMSVSYHAGALRTLRSFPQSGDVQRSSPGERLMKPGG